MPFYLLSSFHQSVMEIFRPLLNWFDSVSMLRSLQPYRDWLPYVTVAVILPLLLWIFLCILRSIQRNRRGRKNVRPSSAPAGTAVRGKAIDIATDFVVHDPWTEPLPGTQAAPAPQPDFPSRPQERGVSAPAPDRTNSEVVPDSAASGPIVLPAPAPRAASGPAATPVPPPEAAPAGVSGPSAEPAPVPSAAPAPAPSAPRHEVPEPPRTAAASPNTPPESEFQRIYIEMYIDLELTTNFSALRTDVNGKLSVGLTTVIVLQAFIIVGGVTRLIPLTGLTLPFVSQGGSSLLASFISVGFLLRCGDEGTGVGEEMTNATGTVHSNSVLGRVALGKRLTHCLIMFSTMFVLLIANLTAIMVVQADEYRSMEGNNHTLAKNATIQRGTISTYDDVVLAQSVAAADGTYERVYPAGDLASHVVGYYSARYGASGIEASQNDVLTGKRSYATWLDVLNAEAGIEQPGNDVILTLNSTIQRAAQDALKGRTGACIAIDPTTGAVLAMASSDTYDAADFESILEASAQSSDSSAASELRIRTIRALVSGRVQGVGFRWTCMEEGSRLGLVGEVSNLDDGDVEVLAQGPADDVSRLIAWLYHGPRWASVASVQIEERRPGSLRHRAFVMGN